MRKLILFIFLLLISSIYASEFRVSPEVNVYMPVDELKLGENGVIELAIHNPIANDVILNGELSLRVPSNVIVEGGDINNCGGGKYYLQFSAKPGESKTITLRLKFPKEGKYTIDAKVLYWPGEDKDNYKDIKLHKVVIVGDNSNTPFLYVNFLVVGSLLIIGVMVICIYFITNKKPFKELENRLKDIDNKLSMVTDELEKQKLKKDRIKILCDLVIAYIRSSSYSNAITTLKDLKDFLNLLGDSNYNEKIDKLIQNLDTVMRTNIKLNKEDIEIINEIINDIKRKYQ